MHQSENYYMRKSQIKKLSERERNWFLLRGPPPLKKQASLVPGVYPLGLLKKNNFQEPKKKPRKYPTSRKKIKEDIWAKIYTKLINWALPNKRPVNIYGRNEKDEKI